MGNRTPAILRILLLLCVAMSPAHAQKGLSKRTRDSFAWFDTLGLPDTKTAKFVLIRTGVSAGSGTLGREDDACAGFLIEDHGATFRAQWSDLTVGLFTKAGKNERDGNYCGYRELSIEKEAQRLLRDLRNPKYFNLWEAEHSFAYHDRLERPTQIFVVARACAQRGHPTLAESLVQALERHPSRDGNRTPTTLREDIESDLQSFLDLQLRISLRDPTETWSTLRDRATKLHSLLPGGRFDDYAKDFSELADEDIRHARTAPKSFDDLPPREKARELVWRLRDEQEAASDEMDEWLRPWPFEPRKSNGAMAALRELGLDAVPALILELRNPKSSRSICRCLRFSDGVFSCGTRDLALSVLDEIAGVNFGWLADFAEKKPDEKWPAVIAVVEDWWRTVETKGERQWLIDIVQTGGSNAVDSADRLRRRFPDAYASAVLAGIRKTTEPRHRSELTKLLWKERDPQVGEFLREELAKGPTLGNRVAAAYGLRHRGDIGAEVKVREEWKQIVKRGLKDENTFAGPGEPPGINLDQDLPIAAEASSHALRFLATCESADALRSLLDTWQDLPARARREVIDCLSGRDFAEDSITVRPASAPTRALIREILLTALDDRTEFGGETHTSEKGSFADPRLCDLAAGALHDHWPDKFAFDPFAPESTRERQRIAMLNVHRREQGLAELTPPPDRPKLPAAKANHVVSVEWENGSVKPGTATAKKFEGWQNKPVDLSAVVTSLTGYARAPQHGTGSFGITVLRAGDSTGVIVRLRLAPGAPAKNAGRNTNESIVSNRDVLHSSGSSGSANSATRQSDWADFLRHAKRALATPADQLFAIKASVSLSE